MKFKDAVAFYELGVPKPHSDKENLDRCKKRIKLNDAEAFFMLGSKYNQGKWGLQKNTNKAIELWNKAADLGSVCAHFSIVSHIISVAKLRRMCANLSVTGLLQPWAAMN